MKKRPKDAHPMDTAPRDGTIIDIWSDLGGCWDREVWFDDKGGPDGDGWVSIMPRPFHGWRLSKGIRQ